MMGCEAGPNFNGDLQEYAAPRRWHRTMVYILGQLVQLNSSLIEGRAIIERLSQCETELHFQRDLQE